jgi:hypothetical protein
MPNEPEILSVLRRHGVPFVIIGAHAVNFHGHVRATEDTDVVWLRSPEAEKVLLAALTEIEAHYIGKEIDPATKLERTHPVSLSFIQASHLMMLSTRCGFLDLFDYVPGFPSQDVGEVFKASIEANGLRYVSLHWLRLMKKASGRPKDRLDLESLPE